MLPILVLATVVSGLPLMTVLRINVNTERAIKSLLGQLALQSDVLAVATHTEEICRRCGSRVKIAKKHRARFKVVRVGRKLGQ